jgi:hypothetical protein
LTRAASNPSINKAKAAIAALSNPSASAAPTARPLTPPRSRISATRAVLLSVAAGAALKKNLYRTRWDASFMGKGLRAKSETVLENHSLKYSSARCFDPIPATGTQYFEVTFSEWGYFGQHIGVVGADNRNFEQLYVKGRSVLTEGPSWSLAYQQELEKWSQTGGPTLEIQRLSIRSQQNTIGVLIDMDSHTLKFRINNTWTDVVFSGLPSVLYPAVSLGYKIGLTASIAFPIIPM